MKMNKRFNYEEEHIEFLKVGYKIHSRERLTFLFNEKFNATLSVINIVSALNYRKIRSGRNGHFPDGHLSWNTGTKGVCKPNTGSFNSWDGRGSIPRPIGSEYPKGDKIMVKIAQPDVWVLKHLNVWINEHGPIPHAHYIIFKDHDKKNCDLENLTMVNASELTHLGILKFKECPVEYSESVILIARIKTKIKERS